MNEKAPDWFVLIGHWVSRGGNGYSLPFLVGARARNKGDTNVSDEDARILLDEIFNHPVKNHVVQIILCPNLGVPVFGLSREKIQGKLFHSTITNEPSVFVRQDLINTWGESADEVLNGILREAKQPIQEGMFSRNFNHTWSDFSEIELQRINRLLENS